MPTLPTYNFSPSPTNYSRTFGGVPGTVAPAPSIYQQVQGAVPGLPNLTSGAAGVIGSQLAGQLSPETINAIKDQSAAWGFGAGMPGSGLANNMGLRNLGLNVENTQHQGVSDYLNFLGGVGATQTNPAINNELAMWNATNNAAPIPADAEQFLMSLVNPQSNGGWPAASAPANYFTPAGSDSKLPLAAGYVGS